MFEFLARSLIAVTLGIVVLLAVLCAFTAETIHDLLADRSARSMRSRRNRLSAAQSYELTLEEAQS